MICIHSTTYPIHAGHFTKPMFQLFHTYVLEIYTIARRRFIKPRENARNLPKTNDRIRAAKVRLIDQNENMIGVVDKKRSLATCSKCRP